MLKSIAGAVIGEVIGRGHWFSGTIAAKAIYDKSKERKGG